MKFKTWHYVVGILVVVGILYFTNAGYFLGSVTGLCSSNDPVGVDGLEISMKDWSFDNSSGVVVDKNVNGSTVKWGDVSVSLLDISLRYEQACGNYLNALINASYFNNRTFASSIQRDRTVIFIEPNNFYWCDQAGIVLLHTQNVLVKDRFFESYVTCMECRANETVNQTCPDGTDLIVKLCNESGYWTYPASCPEPVVDDDDDWDRGVAPNHPPTTPACGEDEVYDEGLGMCVPFLAEVPPEEGTNWWMIGAGVIAVVIVGVLVWPKKKRR